MFYAEFCPYGNRTISPLDTLMAFATREERDEMVERLNDDPYERQGCAMAVTTREVAHRYNLHDFKTDRADEISDIRTCKGRSVFEIPHRVHYRIW